MADTTLTMKLKIQDDGSIVLDKFSGKLAEIPKHVDSMNRSISLIKWDSIVNLAQKAFQAGERIYGMARSTAFATMEIERMSKISGLSTDVFQKLSYAAKLSDVESESLAKGLKLLSRSMEEASQGSGDASKWFSAMGLSVKDSAGNLKPLDVMMKEIADKFARWEDGPRKIAIALAIFGRAGQDIIPLLNEGAAGIQKWASEAEKTGKILSPDLVTKGAMLETQFKKLESSVSVMTKSFILAAIPTKSFGDEIGTLTQKITDFYSRPIVQKYMNFLTGLIPGVQLLQLPSLLAKPIGEYPSETRFKLPITPKGQPPEMGDPEAEMKAGIEQAKQLQKEWLEAYVTGTEIQFTRLIETYPFDKLRQGFFRKMVAVTDFGKILPEYARPTGIYFEDIERQLEAFGTGLGENTLQVTRWDEILKQNVTELSTTAKYVKALEDRMDELLNTAELLSTVRMQPGGPWTGAEFTYPTEDILTDWMVHPKTGLPVLVNQWKDQMNAMKNIFTEFSQNISSVWAENVKGLVSGAESFGDFFKKMSTSMVDVFISAVAKMIANWALFGSVRGAVSGTATGAGILGWLAKAVGISMWQAGGIVPGWKPIEAFQGGGMISRPTLGLIGEGGPEAVIPLKGGKIPIEGGGQTTINYIDIKAVDAPSFVALCKANPAGIIHAVGKSVNRNGPMRTVFK